MEKGGSLFDYTLFKAVEKRRDIADEEIEAAEKRGEVKIQSARSEFPSFWRNKTTQGVFLKDSEELWTPWGAINFVKEPPCEPEGSAWKLLIFRFELLKRFKTSFHKLRKWGGFSKEEPRYYKIESNVDLKKFCLQTGLLKENIREVSTEVSEEEFKELEGEDVFVWGNVPAWVPIYKVHEVERQKLPDPSFPKEEINFELAQSASDAWANLLEVSYEQIIRKNEMRWRELHKSLIKEQKKVGDKGYEAYIWEKWISCINEGWQPFINGYPTREEYKLHLLSERARQYLFGEMPKERRLQDNVEKVKTKLKKK